MKTYLNSLVLTKEHLQAARQQIEQLAYFKWQQAGCPEGADVEYWLEAEREWIQYQYTPDRYPKTSTSRPVAAEHTNLSQARSTHRTGA